MTHHTDSWAQLILGAWVLISPWVLGFSSFSVMKWSNMTVGVALILINVWRLFGDEHIPPNSRGF